MIENVRKFFIMKSGLGSRIGVPAGLIECCLSLWLPAQSLGAHSWMAFSLAVMDFNESVRACPKKFFQVVEEHTREDRERGQSGFFEEAGFCEHGEIYSARSKCAGVRLVDFSSSRRTMVKIRRSLRMVACPRVCKFRSGSMRRGFDCNSFWWRSRKAQYKLVMGQFVLGLKAHPVQKSLIRWM